MKIDWKEQRDCFIEGTKGSIKLFINVRKEVVQSLYTIIPTNKDKNLPQNTIKILPQNPEECTINGIKLKAEITLL